MNSTTSFDSRICIWKCLLLFFWLFQVHLSFLPHAFGTEQICIMIMMFAILLRGRLFINNTETCKSKRTLVLFFFLIMIYSLYRGLVTKSIGIEGNREFYPYCIRVILVLVICSYGLTLIFKDNDEFMRTILICMLIQSITVLLFAVFPNLQHVSDRIFNTVDAYSKYTQGYYTGIGAAEAKGSLKISLGLISCFYLYLRENKMKYIYFYFVITIAATLVARTGFIVSMVGIIFVVLFQREKSNKPWKGFLVSIIVVAVIITFIWLVSKGILLRYNRLGILIDEFIQGGIRNVTFFQKYFGLGQYKTYNHIPSISKRTFWGNGIMDGHTGNGIYYKTDGGFLKMYAGVGVLLMIFSYLIILYLVSRKTNELDNDIIRNTVLFMICFIIIGEFKEIHIFYGYSLSIVFTIKQLHEKELGVLRV